MLVARTGRERGVGRCEGREGVGRAASAGRVAIEWWQGWLTPGGWKLVTHPEEDTKSHVTIPATPATPSLILRSPDETVGWVSLSHTSIPQDGVCWDSQALVTVPEWLRAVQTQAGGLFFTGKILQSCWAYWVTHHASSIL